MTEELTLIGRNVLVLGASSGIGAQVCKHISNLGGTVIASARNEEKLKNVIAECSKGGKKHQYRVTDISQETEIEKLSNETELLDGVVYSIGLGTASPIRFLDQKQVHEVFDVNFFGAVQLISSLVRGKKLKRGCSIVFISSVASSQPFFGGVGYSCSKAALEMFSKSLAFELMNSVRSNVIAPAMVKTALSEKLRSSISQGNMENHVTSRIPMGPGRPDDVANLCCFLLSDAAQWITGMRYDMDGGLAISAFK